jgi:hypothetical protein
MGTGVLCVAISFFITMDYISVLIGAAGASLIWGSTELMQQAIRRELG